MGYSDVAASVLTAVGGADNVESVTTCLTRLRLVLDERDDADVERLRALHGVLGVITRGEKGVEVVLGPSAIEGVAREFTSLAGIGLGGRGAAHPSPLALDGLATDDGTGDSSDTPARVQISPGRRSSYRAQQHAALESGKLPREDLDALRTFLEGADSPTGELATTVQVSSGRHRGAQPSRVLVINGPNLNLLGTREPGIYGTRDYQALVRLCRQAGREAGLEEVRCFQSNHEGALVDEIQAALGTYDGIVINPAAYTHTSVAILDAVKAVGLPCIEVHISKVDEREDFRQVSYIRAACLETIAGEGLEGYRHAILDMARHLEQA